MRRISFWVVTETGKQPAACFTTLLPGARLTGRIELPPDMRSQVTAATRQPFAPQCPGRPGGPFHPTPHPPCGPWGPALFLSLQVSWAFPKLAAGIWFIITSLPNLAEVSLVPYWA